MSSTENVPPAEPMEMPPVDADLDPGTTVVTAEDGVPSTRKLVGDTDWKEITLYTDSSTANNIRSFAIQLTVGPDGDVESDVEINDITIIYRTKSVK